MSSLALTPETVDVGLAAELGASLPEEDRQEFLAGLAERHGDEAAQQQWVWEWSVSLTAANSPQWNEAMDLAADSSTETVLFAEFLEQLR